MIINLHGSVNEKNEIIFDSTQVYFDSKSYVAVTELFIQFSKKIREINGYVATSLIDRSPVNLKQEIIFWNQRENSRTVHVTPTHLAAYKIQCTSLQASVFEIHVSELDESAKIEKIYLQLKITNARI